MNGYKINDKKPILYSPEFDINYYSPKPGQLFLIYIPLKYISHEYKPIAEQKIGGTDYYTSWSDIAAIVMHSGCLFLLPKSKARTYPRYCTVLNYHEVACRSEARYKEMAAIQEFPLDYRIKGIIVQIFIEQSLPCFLGTTRNGITSKDQEIQDFFAIRINDYLILTPNDSEPECFNCKDQNYSRDAALISPYKITDIGDVGISFQPASFYQFFNRDTIDRGFLNIYRFFFDVSPTKEININIPRRFEIVSKNEFFQIFEVVPLPLPEKRSLVTDNLLLTDISCSKGKITAKNEFSPVVSIVLIRKDK